jgi:zinc protease
MKKLFTRSLLLILVLLPLSACMPVKQESTAAIMPRQSSPPQSHTTHERLMANGMKVIVREDHRAPVVVSQVWYKVGSGYEPSGITGISHVLEHMMFKGTDKYPPGEFSRIIAEQGGSENAFTGRDYTAYFQQLEKSRLPIAFELEADRMRNLLLLPEEFTKEIQVVMEERRMRTEDKPSSLTYEQFMATASLSGPYHHPIIGWMNDLENLTVDDLRAWYQRWYAPNNATLVVAGDVIPEEVFALAEKHFGRLKPSTLPAEKSMQDTSQRGERRITVKAPAKLPVLIMGYKTPTLRTVEEQWKAYALEVLANILDGGDSARLSTELLRGSQIAASAGAGYDLTTRHDSLFTLEGIPAQGHTIAELEQALHKQVERLKNELVTQHELDRIKAQVTAAKVYELDSVFYQAMQIGTLETIGLDWRIADDYLKHINAVTAEQVRQVAREFLVNDQLTVAILEPQPIDNSAAMAKGASHGSRH